MARDPGADQRMMEFEASLRKATQSKPKVKKPHASCKTPETCIAQNRCRKTGKALVNGKVAK